MLARVQADRAAIINDHYYLCRRGARKFWRSGLDRSDLEQVAAIGLIKACDRYRSATRTPFEAYAWLLIVGELMHYVRDHEHLVRMPRRLKSLEKACTRAEDVLVGRLGREPCDVEIASSIGVHPSILKRVRDAQASLRGPARFDDPNEAPRLIDAVASCSDPVSLEDRALLRMALGVLTRAQSTVVLGIYALGLTRAELSVRLGESQRSITRLHDAAIRRMGNVLTETFPSD